ncbi:deoxyguanosinetriphosphate triphosphohydrolase family protein [Flavobacterium undicola]|uniref:deoxyguanosinetriphosphate triphosphohydrolase family protein n=1 Tax=Flavobacterium undicola TaxID=1932779 RepID=UPI0013776682|nr:dNTP triphosphohydrolase [Flavobacterium undicola]MBA0882940.1 dNTP triphosphohydrolase [Flavobacterium undicola]
MTLNDYVAQKEAEVEKISNIREHAFPASTLYYRNDADVDYARVLYSSSARRLQGKMQLFIPKDNVFYRNRLTHSLEVSQISKIIAQKFRLKDTLTVQTCSLAHDLGNPPFGHAGEVFLSEYTHFPYEGNAQSFRILTHLEEKHYQYNGLNLTLRTLLGTIKYFNNHQQNKDKFLYDEDYQKVKKWSDDYGIKLKTIDCEIMDIADEIAYAAHDLEDALKLKYFTVGELLHEFKNSKFKDAYDDLKNLVEIAQKFASKSHTYDSSEEYSILLRKELTSGIINSLINDVELVQDEKGEYYIGYKKLENLAKGLKKLTFHAIKRNTSIIEYENLGKHILQNLFEMYMDKSYNKSLILLPADYRDEDNWERTVLDYIGGMMDIFAIQQYEKYFGKLKDTGIYKK